MLVVPYREGPRLGVVAQPDLAGVERLGVGPAEDRKQKLVAWIEPQRLPLDVEVARVRRCTSPLEHVEPPRIVGRQHTHVIGHEIDDEPEADRAQRRDELRQALLTAELLVDPGRIDHVVAMGASAARLQDG